MLDSLFTLQCGDNISHTRGPICIALHSRGLFLDINCPDALGTINGDDVAARITAYEAVFGNRTVRVYSNAAVTSGVLTFDGYDSLTGDCFALYTLTWQS